MHDIDFVVAEFLKKALILYYEYNELGSGKGKLVLQEASGVT